MLLRSIAVSFALLASACASAQVSPSATPAPAVELLPGPKPAPYASTIVGEYDTNAGVQFIIEDAGKLYLLDTARASLKRTLLPADGISSLPVKRRSVGPEEGQNQLQVRPVRPVAEVRAEALLASPPVEPKAARTPDLVELTSLDPTIKLEIRYATSNNFLGTKLYDEARAFMQRPAAEAVVRANQKLRTLGYGLLIHDAYRPWYVTKIFWDATPTDKRWLVANPAEGSKHNRGAAVDLTLFDLATGQPVEMPSTYDESTGRAYANYPGGTSLQRWHRALLRNAMVGEGFVVNPSEWWHFDYGSWRDYPLGNVAFDRIAR
ncbi:MAG: D-alanyl-D-alanine dipeptidase [Gemmatimonadetes bacterium]|nr:D-alanyl-D-alanine dipeptidase [Gemmatimonadota bacterium]